MGEMAEDNILGHSCCLCGAFFDSGTDELYEHGYPAVCWDCWKDLSKKERKQYQRAEVDTL
jgi:hypothetical protein